MSQKKFFKNKYFGYYTGDLVQQLRNKELKILGRVDNQVKLMGHRIELEEIENEILHIFNIKECLIKLVQQSLKKYPNSTRQNITNAWEIERHRNKEIVSKILLLNF